jgi:hypothetical protein
MDMKSIDFDYESEELNQLVFGLIRSASSCDEKALDDLETLMGRVNRKIRADGLEAMEVETFIDLEEELSLILNDTGFRNEEAGPNATNCPRLLEIVYKKLVPFNENFEVVLAVNPFLPETIANKLIKSEFAWEEDGTTQALARATKNPAILQKLSKSWENSTRFEVAANPSCPPEVLEKLAKDVEISDSFWYCNYGIESFIQVAVVRNLNTPTSVVEGFLTGKYSFSEEDFIESHGWSLVSNGGLDELRTLLATEASKRLKS